MRNLTILLTIGLFVSCQSFDKKILQEERFSSGIEYGTNKKIPAKYFQKDDYTIVTGYSTKSATMGLFRDNKEILFKTCIDGSFDTIMTENLNNDRIPDFLIGEKYEDGTTLYALISKTKDEFSVKKITDNFDGYFCDASASNDTLKFIQPLTFIDTKDGKKEILVNYIKMNGKLFKIACSEEFKVE